MGLWEILNDFNNLFYMADSLFWIRKNNRYKPPQSPHKIIHKRKKVYHLIK